MESTQGDALQGGLGTCPEPHTLNSGTEKLTENSQAQKEDRNVGQANQWIRKGLGCDRRQEHCDRPEIAEKFMNFS